MSYSHSDSVNLHGQFVKPPSLPAVSLPGVRPVPVSLPAQCTKVGTVLDCPPLQPAPSTPLAQERVEERAGQFSTCLGEARHPPPSSSPTSSQYSTCLGEARQLSSSSSHYFTSLGEARHPPSSSSPTSSQYSTCLGEARHPPFSSSTASSHYFTSLGEARHPPSSSSQYSTCLGEARHPPPSSSTASSQCSTCLGEARHPPFSSSPSTISTTTTSSHYSTCLGEARHPPFSSSSTSSHYSTCLGEARPPPSFSTTTKSSHYSNCLEESSHPPSTTPSQQSNLCPTTFSSSTSSPSSLTSITSPVKYPSLDIRLIADPVVEEPLQEENREISTLIRLLSDFSRQGPGGQLNPSFISLPFCILCDLGAKCQGPYCQGLKKPKSQKLMTRMPPVSDSIPGLQFLPRLANEPVQTPRSRLSLRKIKCLTPSIFRSKKMGKSSSIPIKTSSHQVKVKTMMEKPVTKAPPVSPRIEQPNLRWLQLFLMNCGQNKKRKSMQSKSSPIKSSLERKLEVSELSCKRNPPLKSSSGSQNLKAEVQLVKSSDRLVLFFFINKGV